MLSAPLFACSDRDGGYTRVMRCGFRNGDRAPMAIIEYVGREGEIRPARPGTAGKHVRRSSPNSATSFAAAGQALRQAAQSKAAAAAAAASKQQAAKAAELR